jgi:hypothetical protein
MNEAALREWLAKKLKRDDVPDELWEYLVRVGYVEDAEVTENRSSLLEAAREQLRLARVLQPLVSPARTNTPYTEKPPIRERVDKVTPRHSDYEKGRTEALAEYLAFQASRNPLVQRFRRRVLEGKVLTPEQACNVAFSAATCRFSLDWFVDKGIPTTGHTAHFVEHYYAMDEDGTLYRAEDIFVDPPGEVFREGTVEPVYEEDLPKLAFHDSEHPSDVFQIPVESGSVLDDLRKASKEVAHDLHLWTEAQVAWFVLTDQMAPVPALRANLKVSDFEWMRRCTITLTVEPWVSAQTVERAYREMQRVVLGGSNRPLATRNLEVFRFVISEFAEEVNRDESSYGQEQISLSWRTLLQRWNQEHTSSEYKDVRRFYRDFLRAGKAVVAPDYLDHPLFVREITVP